ncbi:MAG: endonuclease/exonuclease/phosphatase family protein, partial [Synergistaceae bacterium]|nr:endonuclease/exonuclease/phosphatase family protein [Synergistaceae bacterium]
KESWDYLFHSLKADIVLAQEMGDPEKVCPYPFVYWNKIGGNRDWGSGIASKLNLTPVDIELTLPEFHGAIAIANIFAEARHPVTLISLYGLLDKLGYSITNLHRMLSDLTPLLNGHLQERLFILGGDLNADVQIDPQNRTPHSHRILFARIRDFGLIDYLAKFHKYPVQTLRHARSKIPWQNDYLYASKSLSAENVLLHADVIGDLALFPLSDHNPVVGVFEVPEI